MYKRNIGASMNISELYAAALGSAPLFIGQKQQLA